MQTNFQRTRVIAMLHSHHGNQSYDGVSEGQQVNLSDDVVLLSTQKNTKAAGKWQIQLVPRRNYLNLIFPNDMINIYIDPGDGERGFVRTMMGYVDRVERTETVDENGAMQTRYVVIGTDFQKAIDKTHLYWNDHLRQTLDERFARSDSGTIRGGQSNAAQGSALRNAGLTAHGTPADFVESMLSTLLGFGQQWRLPGGYKYVNQGIQNNRRKRVQRAMGRLPQNILELLSTLGFNQELIDLNIQDVINTARAAAVSTETESGSEESVAQSKELRTAAIQLSGSSELIAFRSALETTEQDYPTGILDLISLDLMEAMTIDGYHSNIAIWQNSGSLAQLLYGNCNDIINELIFDLRPVSDGPEGNDGGIKEGGYSRQPDELGINVEGVVGYEAPVAAVKYVPSVVFREYPYSVVEEFDVSSINFLPGPGAAKTTEKKVSAIEPMGVNFINPVKDGIVSEGWGFPRDYRANPTDPSPIHKGLDIRASIGTPVFAIEDGDVIQSGLASGPAGKRVRIRHPSGFDSGYLHLDTILVGLGPVTRGTQIGTSGISGISGRSAHHLHFDLHLSSSRIAEYTSTFSTPKGGFGTSSYSRGTGAGTVPVPADPLIPATYQPKAKKNAKNNNVTTYPDVVREEVTVDQLLAEDLEFLGLTDEDNDNTTNTNSAGKVQFGPVFSIGPGVPGRKVYKHKEALSPVECEFFVDQEPLKHLDVVVIENTDVVSASVGRSDEDLWNVFHLNSRSSKALNETYNRGQFSNIYPILNQISIARNGLRVWEGTTMFASYSQDLGSCKRKNANKVGGDIDTNQERTNLVRWALMMDHWYQHNTEYLSGTITLRSMPELRVGYRLDWKDRNESYYVESVSHSWVYPQAMQTTVQVVRGQRNDPFPAFVPPVFFNPSNDVISQASGDRSASGRLARSFKVRDTPATIHATNREGPHNEATNDVDELENLKNGVVVTATGTTTHDADEFIQSFAPEIKDT